MHSVGKSRGHSIVLHRRVSHEHAPSPEHAQPRSHGNQLIPIPECWGRNHGQDGRAEEKLKAGNQREDNHIHYSKGEKLEIKFSFLTITEGWVI